MSSALNKSKWILRSGFLCAALLATGCMKAPTHGQTVLDPSQEGSAEAYSPEILTRDWREDVLPKTDIDIDMGELSPAERRARPAAKVRLQGDLPDLMLEDDPVDEDLSAGGTTPSDAATEVSTDSVGSEPAMSAEEVTVPTVPAAAAGETAVDTPSAPPAEKSARRRFRPIPAPKTKVERPGATATSGPVAPGTRTSGVTAATGSSAQQRPGLTAASGKSARSTGVSAATGTSAATAASGRRRFRPTPPSKTKPSATAPATTPGGKAATVTAPAGQTATPTERVTEPRAAIPTERATPPRVTGQAKPAPTAPATPSTDGYSVRPADNRDITETGTITPTIYFLAVLDEDKESCQDKVGMHLTNGSVAMSVCRRTASFCSEQGSCLIKKGGKWQTFNVVRRVNGVDRYIQISDGCVYGYGVRGICLDPFYSVAADLSVYDPGDVIFIPKLRGLMLPNGQRHDGYLIVRDQGRGVKGRGRFDFFSGAMNWGDRDNPFVKMRLSSKGTDMTYHKVAGEVAARVKAKRGYPKLPSRGAVHSALNQNNTKGVPTSPLNQPSG